MASIRRPGRASIFSPATEREREENFESYWRYQQRRDGEILEEAKDLSEKQKNLARFRADTVRTRRPVPDTFHRNYIARSEEHTSELQSHSDLVCRLLLEKKKQKITVAENHSEHPHSEYIEDTDSDAA